MFTHAPALFDGLRVVFFEQTIADVRHASWQAASMEQAVERGKIVEALFLKNRLKIKLNVSLSANERGIAEQTERKTVGDDTPNVFGSIQEFLNERVRRKTRATAGRHAAKFMP